MDISVLHDRVLLKAIEPEETSIGGIVLASSAKEKKYEATVVRVGTGKPVKDGTPIPLTVQVGDIVIYNPNSVVAVKINNEQLLVIKEDEIYAILESE